MTPGTARDPPLAASKAKTEKAIQIGRSVLDGRR